MTFQVNRHFTICFKITFKTIINTKQKRFMENEAQPKYFTNNNCKIGNFSKKKKCVVGEELFFSVHQEIKLPDLFTIQK